MGRDIVSARDLAEFLRKRFLEPRNEPDPWNHAFGYGRRICPGRYLADDSLYITISRLLAAFNITRVLDQNGKPLDIEIRMTPGVISRPVDFPYNISPRSKKHEELVRVAESELPPQKSDAVHLEKGFLG